MIDLLIVAGLVVLKGAFALSELAVISARKSSLEVLAAAGRRGAESALALAADPGRFLSAVQIGITLVGIVNGAYSGEAFGGSAARMLEALGAPRWLAVPVGYGGVLGIITYVSVVIGELVPKALALRHAEAIACLVAPAMTVIARGAAPLVWLLDVSTELVLRTIGQPVDAERRITDQELKAMIADAERTGVIATGERRIIDKVMWVADNDAAHVMTPRRNVEWLDVTAGEDELREQLTNTAHSRLPVGEGSVEALIGVVDTRTALAALLEGKPLDLRALAQTVPHVPDTLDALRVIGLMRTSPLPIVFVYDEHGEFAGLVTPTDVLEAITGQFGSDTDSRAVAASRRDDGSWLFAGDIPVEDMARTTGIVLPQQRDYATCAGFLLARFQRLPRIGETIETDGWRFEVVDLDGRRIDRVLATPRTEPSSRKAQS